MCIFALYNSEETVMFVFALSQRHINFFRNCDCYQCMLFWHDKHYHLCDCDNIVALKAN